MRGNHFKEKALPLGVVLEFFDVVGEAVVHLFAGGAGKNGEVAETQSLFLHVVEASVVATIELLEPAVRSRSDRDAGAGGEIVVGEDAMRLFW